MKNIMYAIVVFIIVHCTLLIENCFCQWSVDVRLTNDTASSYTYDNNSSWVIASSGDSVHVVWWDNRDGNREVYYKRSTNGGINWGADTRLTNAAGNSWFPSIALSGSLVHIAWEDNRDGNDEIYYKRSTDAGITWGIDTRLTNADSFSYSPSVSVNGSNIHVVWQDFRDGNAEIYYKSSTDGGTSWGADKRLTNNPAFCMYVSVAVSGTTVHIAWEDYRDGIGETYYKRSTDGGINWGIDTRLTNYNSGKYWPSIAVSGSAIHVVWPDTRDGNYEIYYKRSTDGGITWGTDERLTIAPSSSWSPNPAVSGQILHVVWRDYRFGGNNGEIYYKRSTNAGVSWEEEIQLTNNPYNSSCPFISLSGSVVHVVWNDNRDGNTEIYYKRNPMGNLVRIENISSEMPSSYSLEQNYPNPFNPITYILFDLPKSNHITLKIYNALGREVANLVNEQLQPGTYKVTFDGIRLPSGIYFYSLKTGNYTETKRMVLIK